jgi:EmrB/QacA subfamily drug resistance transporter
MSASAAGPTSRSDAERQSRDEAGFGSRERWLLVVCCIAQFMVILDLSIVNVALPSIQFSLGFSSIDLQWVVDAYAIAFAGFLMLGGRATDRFGPRRILVAALGAFACASLVGGVAPDQLVLIVARAAQGVSGALMAAGSLAAITSSFASGPARHRAIGLWAAMNGAGGAAGALLGGVITQELGWRWILLINPPIGAAAAVGAYVLITDHRPRRESPDRLDLPGALTLTGGLVVLVYGIVDAGYLGWSAAGALAPIVIGLVLLATFVGVELRFAASPLVPLQKLTPQLRVANGIVLFFSAALFPMWYVSSLYLQQVLGLSPAHTGLVFLPMALTIMVAARQAGRLVSSFGVRAVLTAGLCLMTAGLLLLARIGTSGSATGWVVLPGVLVALGIALSIVPSTIAATQGASPADAGLASGLVNTSRQIGGAIGIALLVSLASERTSTLIGDSRGVPSALTDGFRLAYLVGAGLCTLAAVAAAALLPRAPSASTGSRRLRFPAAVVAIVGCFVGADYAAAGRPGPPIGAYTLKGAYTFASAPALHPPVIKADTLATDGSLAPGYIMVANFYDLTSHPMVGQSGPLILDSNLQPVWFRPVPTDVVASNLSVQTYDRKPALAWWQGVISDTGATQSGEDVVVDQHYRSVATLKGADGWVITLHELVIRGHDAWVTASKNIPMNLTKYGGANNGSLVDSAVQEYDLGTGKLLYSWDASKHIPLSDSEAPPPANGFPWDAYHLNSISLEKGERFLVSMRNTWAVYQVDAATGDIEWTLGGKHSSFAFAPRAAFEWQHDAALHGSEVTLFDDDCCEISGAGTYLAPAGPSRGLVLKLDRATHSATLVAEYMHGDSFDAAYMGNLQRLADGNVFVGWGAQPYFSEYSKSGRLLLDGELPGPDLSYRATLDSWVGLPLTAPSAAVRRSGGRTTVYASWNGATRVAGWRVLGGTRPGGLRPVGQALRSGFETAIQVVGRDRTFEAQALDGEGRVIGTSRPAHLPLGAGHSAAQRSS